jgi:hypothetical protein
MSSVASCAPAARRRDVSSERLTLSTNCFTAASRCEGGVERQLDPRAPRGVGYVFREFVQFPDVTRAFRGQAMSGQTNVRSQCGTEVPKSHSGT